jgi:hypothetical protein
MSFFCVFSKLSVLCWAKNFSPINKNLAHFAHRCFLTQEKFAHLSKNAVCATDDKATIRCE